MMFLMFYFWRAWDDFFSSFSSVEMEKSLFFSTMSRVRSPVLWIFLLLFSNFVNAFSFPFTPPLLDGARQSHMEEYFFLFSKFFHVLLVEENRLGWIFFFWIDSEKFLWKLVTWIQIIQFSSFLQHEFSFIFIKTNKNIIHLTTATWRVAHKKVIKQPFLSLSQLCFFSNHTTKIFCWSFCSVGFWLLSQFIINNDWKSIKNEENFDFHRLRREKWTFVIRKLMVIGQRVMEWINHRC